MLAIILLSLFFNTINTLTINNCNKIGEITNSVNGFDFYSTNIYACIHLNNQNINEPQTSVINSLKTPSNLTNITNYLSSNFFFSCFIIS